MEASGQLSVPPGFRFHPTDEELLYYYLRKKVAHEAMDLDVIREVDLNKLEPWDLRETCRIGTGPQNEWYCFSHKDKKYPTGTRTNRATDAGFWKATGRDKAIFHSDSQRIGMRKTLVFYTGRAPRGQKTEWIMHEYRLLDDNPGIQEGGWVICRVYRKKNNQRSLASGPTLEGEQLLHCREGGSMVWGQRQNPQWPYDPPLGNSMQLPQLLSPEPSAAPYMAAASNPSDSVFSQSLMKLTTGGGGLWKQQQQQHHQQQHQQQQQQRFHSEWSIVDKLLASHQNLDQVFQGKWNPLLAHTVDHSFSVLRFPPHSVGCEADLLRFTK